MKKNKTILEGGKLAKSRSLIRRTNMHLTESQANAIIEEEKQRLEEEEQRMHLFEMATIGAQRWGNKQYSIQIHGASTSDRATPHIHIYLKNDNSKKEFNFEISIIDLVSQDRLSLIYQFDRENNIKIKNKANCSWTGYADILYGLKGYLFSPPQSPLYKACIDNLHAAIYAWNNETDMSATLAGRNPMKEWLDARKINILPRYQKYFEPIDFEGKENQDTQENSENAM